MTNRAEKWSTAFTVLGVLGFAGALWWALPGYVALAFLSLVVVFCGFGAQGIGRVLYYSVAGVDEKAREQNEAPPP